MTQPLRCVYHRVTTLVVAFVLLAATNAQAVTPRRLAIVIAPPNAAFVAAASELRGATVTIVNAPANALTSIIGQIQERAVNAPESALAASIAEMGALLHDHGFVPSALREYDETFVIATMPVPIDLINLDGTPLGLQTVIAHVVAPDATVARGLIRRASSERTAPLTRAALLAIAPLPSGFNRGEHDIMKAAMTLADRVPTDIIVEPNSPITMAYFKRRDVQILHLDTHGANDAIQLGTNDDTLFGADAFPSHIGPRLLLLVGCETGAGRRSLGPALVLRGADAVVGMPFEFVSGAPTGGEITDSTFYDTLWLALTKGEPVGRALLSAKQTLPPRIWSAAWLLFGSPDLRFVRTPR